ncbi:hypothetical protein GCM10022207_94620 [Streptomyces lannensis]|uniref:Uncharacterized protein n=1 Tax=Streptomyces lannensis TaxID=766498 RepID=A0ABP7LYT3_9ACTN
MAFILHLAISSPCPRGTLALPVIAAPDLSVLPSQSVGIEDTYTQKKGTQSVGVTFLYSGLPGDVRTSQTMGMLTYSTAVGHAYRCLYLHVGMDGRSQPVSCGRGA